jgi:hypothetical protein
MVGRLIQYIPDQMLQVSVTMGKGSITRLPIKSLWKHLPFVNILRRTGFYIPYQIRDCHLSIQPYQNMRVVRHTVDGNGFLATFFDYPTYDFLDFLSAVFCDDLLSVPRRKYDMDQQLCECTWHNFELLV